MKALVVPFLTVWFLLPAFAPAQDIGNTTSRESLEAKIEALKNDSGADETVLANYQQALAQLEETDRLRNEVEALRTRLQSSAPSLKSTQEELDNISPEPLKLPETLDEAEKALRKIDSDLETATAALENLNQTEAANRTRSAAIPEEIQKVSAALEETPAPGINEDDSEAQQARNTLQAARNANLQLQLELLNLEKEYLETAPALLLARQNLAAKQIETLTDSMSRMSSHVTQLREAAAQAVVKQAETSLEMAADEPEAIRSLAKENVELANRKGGETGISSLLSDAGEALARSEEELRTVTRRVETAVSRTAILEKAGLSLDSETGFLLRQQRGEMPSASQLKTQIAKLLRDATSAHLEQIKLEEQQRDFLLRRDQILREAIGTDADEAIRQRVEELLNTRADLYEELIADQRTYVSTLDERLRTLQKTREKVISHRQFVDERLLWIRSSPFYSPKAVKADLNGIREITVGDTTQQWFDSLLRDLRNAAPLWIIATILWLLWVFINRRVKNRIVKLNIIARDSTCTRFRPTLEATLLTICVGLTLPTLFAFLAWRSGDVAPALQNGLFTVSLFIFFFEGLRQLSKPEGLLKSHLGVSAEKCSLIHRNTRWLLIVYPFLIFPAEVLISADQNAESGRGFFILAMISMAVYMHRLFLPGRQLLSSKNTRPWFAWPVYLLAVITPVFLTLGAVFGFFHSVVLLRQKYDATFWILALAAFTFGFFLRWVLVSRRHTAIMEVINQRNSQEEGAEGEDDRSIEEIKADAAGLVNLQLKTRQLARLIVASIAAITLWSVWAPTLPALNMLDRITIWDAKETVETTASSSSGSVPFLPGTSSEPAEEERVITKERVSLQNLLFSVFVLFLTVVGARNIPAFLDLLFLRRYYTKRGGAFAITTTLRYLIIAVGVAYALGHVGIEWSKIQWIAAAITLGVGFGLQEIFANFVAGLIILFERPIRLGDWVTLGDISGQVSKIRIRATTITDLSNKELVVPNKEFITGRLVNWTLTDPEIRVEVPVGIAYGSDTAKAKEVLEEVGRSIPEALTDPPPKAVFLAFGDSTLDFELRVYIHEAGRLIPIRSQLHFAIDDAFRKAGIEIAFPQRDIHIRSMPPSGNQLPLTDEST